jgi:hypothetical protein
LREVIEAAQIKGCSHGKAADDDLVNVVYDFVVLNTSLAGLRGVWPTIEQVGWNADKNVLDLSPAADIDEVCYLLRVLSIISKTTPFPLCPGVSLRPVFFFLTEVSWNCVVRSRGWGDDLLWEHMFRIPESNTATNQLGFMTVNQGRAAVVERGRFVRRKPSDTI